jgi:hypothetical protein
MRRIARSIKSSPAVAVAAACMVVASLYFARDVLIPLTRARYLCKRLHQKHADLRIIVGLWAFGGKLAPTNSRLALAAPGQLVVNLREAQEHIDQPAQPFKAAPKSIGGQLDKDVSHPFPANGKEK